MGVWVLVWLLFTGFQAPFEQWYKKLNFSSLQRNFFSRILFSFFLYFLCVGVIIQWNNLSWNLFAHFNNFEYNYIYERKRKRQKESKLTKIKKRCWENSLTVYTDAKYLTDTQEKCDKKKIVSNYYARSEGSETTKKGHSCDFNV